MNAFPKHALARVAIENAAPEINGGRFHAKGIVGQEFEVSANIHADGPDSLFAVLRHRHEREAKWRETAMAVVNPGLDLWTAAFFLERQGYYEYTIDAWIDTFATWRTWVMKKFDAGEDVSSELLEGTALIRHAAERANGADAQFLRERTDMLASDIGSMTERVHAAVDPDLRAIMVRYPDRSRASAYHRILRVFADRRRAQYGAWYEMFLRSAGTDPSRSATFREAEGRLADIAGMGFDVLYLPPIHPIGLSFRKGKDNHLKAVPGDPGSPWAIGSSEGGHKSVHPELGTLEDFKAFIKEAERQGLEVAMDLALQCSPDHPYVREHPEWFKHRPDGGIKYAENPPKKYQDIYPLDFECEDWRGLWREIRTIVEFWLYQGVRIFRVDNPHTKPYGFWEWLIGDIHRHHPDVLFLAEAFTRPKVMFYLAKLGFSQSYTYFTWRNSKAEIMEYMAQLAHSDAKEYLRPNFFANTPDILHEFLQKGGRPAFEIRLILAATLSPSYGIYSGFELCENEAVPGTEEYQNSEKYEIKSRDWNKRGNIKDLVMRINTIRRNNPALQRLDNIRFLETDDDRLLCYLKATPDRSNIILTVVNLDPFHIRQGTVQVPLNLLGIPPGGTFKALDLLSGLAYEWRDRNFIRLDPGLLPAHIFQIEGGRIELLEAFDLSLRLDELLQTQAKKELERILPVFLSRSRWFAGKSRRINRVQIKDVIALSPEPDDTCLAIVDVEYADASTEIYLLPLACAFGDKAKKIKKEQAGIVLTALKTGNDVPEGVLYDASHDDNFCGTLLKAFGEHSQFTGRLGEAVATTTRIFDENRDFYLAARQPKPVGADHSNSTVVIGNRLMLKVYRHLMKGVSIEVEMGRFLTERANFRHMPPTLGFLEYRKEVGAPSSLALLQGFVENKGEAWDFAAGALNGYLRNIQASTKKPQKSGFSRDLVAGILTQTLPEWLMRAMGPYVDSARLLGRRTAELHRALACAPEDPYFAPEIFSRRDQRAAFQSLRNLIGKTFQKLREGLAHLSERDRGYAEKVLALEKPVLEIARSILRLKITASRIRCHGDYHLGQVLFTGDDFTIIDFEGEPGRPLGERRIKQCALRDVASMLRSYHYLASAALTKQPDLEPWITSWLHGIYPSFFQAYVKAGRGSSFLPKGDDEIAILLRFYLLEKAVYELGYELNNRPDWVVTPMRGIVSVVEGYQQEAELAG